MHELYRRLIEREKERLAVTLRSIGDGLFATDVTARRRRELELDRQRAHLAELIEARTTELRAANEQLARHMEALERKDAILKESEERYRTLAEAAPDMIFLCTPAGKVLYVNAQAAAHLGSTPEAVAGKELKDLFPAEIAASYLRAMQTVYLTGQPFVAESPEPFQPSGRWIDTRLMPIRDAAGRITAVMGLARDISDRKRAEIGLRESEERYRRLFVESPVALWEEDFSGVKQRLASLQDAGVRDFQKYFDEHPAVVQECAGLVRVLDVNQACMDLYRAASKEALLNGIDRTFTDASRALFRQELVAFTAGQTLFEGETETVSLTGETNYVTVHVYVAAGYEQSLGRVLVSMIDLTERRRAEDRRKRIQDLERSNSELEQFAYVASHDLQEPLRMVSSYVQLLERRYRGRLDKDADEFIGYAVDGVNRMRALINDLLAYSRVSTRGSPFEAADAADAFRSACDDLRLAIAESSAVVTHAALPVVMADRVQLAQLFQNLIGNSIKFRREAEPPQIHVSAERKGGEWVFGVQDNGIGIEPKHWDRIFLIFQRLHTREKYPGTGIGLAVCQRIVERHGGRIWVSSTPGKGSLFCFTLPADTDGAR